MRIYAITVLVFGLVLSVSGCRRQDPVPTAENSKEKASLSMTDHSDAPGQTVLSGKVTFVQDAANYTYVEIEKDGEKNWAAGPKTDIKVGDEVITAPGMFMKNFESKSLNRSFESILFTSALKIKGQEDSKDVPNPHGAMSLKDGADSAHKGVSSMGMPRKKGMVESPAPGSITKADDGYTVAEIYSLKEKLKGKEIKVKGKIVKASGFILDAYWYHIQDGTGDERTGDLTFTSADGEIGLGSVVTIKGIPTLDKDLGSGYFFEVLLEKSILESTEPPKAGQ